uniref:Uncharacterized protein n=1 Tax=Magallana gigas TaxID=29159 RepID=K1PTQ3_MAGGI
MYANKKTDVNEKAKVTGMKSQKPGKHAHVKAVEVADEGSKTGVIVAVVLVLITVLGVGAAVFIVLIPVKTLTADINIRLQDDSAKDSSVMAFVAVGILIGHLLAILAIIICRCYKARSDTDSDGQKSVDAGSKGHKQEKTNEGVDRSLSNHSLK